MPEGRFKLLYDGECPFCRREVEWLRRRDLNGNLALLFGRDVGAHMRRAG